MTFASLYIKKQKTGIVNVNNVKAKTIQGQLQQSFNAAKNGIKNFNLKEFSQNLTALSKNPYTQTFAVAGISKIINGEPVTNQSMLDSIFNGYAPAMGMTATQSGFNGVAQMKAAISNGNVNVTSFMTGFHNAMNATKSAMVATENYAKYGQEIKIDMIVDLTYQNIAETPDRRVQSGQTYNEYIHVLPKTLSFNGKIKEGQNHTSTEFKEMIENIMLSKKPFTFRAGAEIYEDYIFTSFVPSRNFEQSLAFQAEIKKIEPGDVSFEKVSIPRPAKKGKKRVIKHNKTSKVGNAAKKVGNATAPKHLYGIGRIINIDQGVADIVKELNTWK